MGPASDAAAYLFGELDRLNVLKTEFFSTETASSACAVPLRMRP